MLGLASALYAAAGKVYASSKTTPGSDLDGRRYVGIDSGPPWIPRVAREPAGRRLLPHIVRGKPVPNPAGGGSLIPGRHAHRGRSSAYEVYEEAIGLLTAVEPSLLGVEVAYGGYIAHNYVYAEGVAPIGGVTAPPGTLSADAANTRSKS